MSHDEAQQSAAAPDAGFSFPGELTARAGQLRKGERTKTAIQVAVCACLETSALADLTIADICDSAGVSHGTFYIYFANRDAAVADVLVRFSAFVQAKMRQASRGEPGRPARAATSAYARLFEHNLGLMKCLLRHLDGFPEARIVFQDLNREWLDTVVAATASQWQLSGRAIDHDELMRRAYALGGMTDQYLAGLLLDRDPNMAAFSRDREAVIETLDLLWERGLQP